jgi:hypothetical protein
MVSNNWQDFPYSIHTKKFSEKRIFMQTSVIHNDVNIGGKLSGFNNFAVNYQGVFCG